MRCSSLLLALLSFLTCVELGAQATYDFSKLDAYFDTLDKHQQVMGSIAILRKDELLYTRALGAARLAQPGDTLTTIPASPDRRYRVGSITKTYTAALILRLAELKQLRLDDKLSSWFPGIPNAEQITIEQMLNHTAGINSITDDPLYLVWRTREMPRQKMLDAMAERSPSFAPGEDYGYSNSGYILLGYIVEEVTGASLADAMQQYLFGPLQLEETRMSEPVNPFNNEAMSYTWSGQGWQVEPNDHPTVPGAAGALSATASDVARFYRALFAGRLLDSTALVSMMELGNNNYGYGLLSFPYGKRTAYGHTGGISGFRSMGAHFTDDSTTVVFLGNGIRTSPNDILVNALAALYQSPFEIPDFNLRPATYSTQELTALAGTYKSTAFPLAITISVAGNNLQAQATGQSSFALDAYENYLFKFEPAGIELEFTAPGKMTLRQGGQVVAFARE